VRANTSWWIQEVFAEYGKLSVDSEKSIKAT
jgi:hypothetical protein